MFKDTVEGSEKDLATNGSKSKTHGTIEEEKMVRISVMERLTSFLVWSAVFIVTDLLESSSPQCKSI